MAEINALAIQRESDIIELETLQTEMQALIMDNEVGIGSFRIRASSLNIYHPDGDNARTQACRPHSINIGGRGLS
jgi:hypothetical protein